jgi:hypothetical protein
MHLNVELVAMIVLGPVWFNCAFRAIRIVLAASKITKTNAQPVVQLHHVQTTLHAAIFAQPRLIGALLVINAYVIFLSNKLYI